MKTYKLNTTKGTEILRENVKIEVSEDITKTETVVNVRSIANVDADIVSVDAQLVELNDKKTALLAEKTKIETEVDKNTWVISTK